MSHTKKPTIEKIILALLGLLALAALVRTMFLGLEIDEEYALSLSFRLVRGDRLFYSMWEPHQLAALPPALLIGLFTAVAGTTTGVLLFVRGAVLAVKLALAVWFYRSLRGALGGRCAYLLALVVLAFTPKWFLGPDYVSQQFHFTLAAFLFLYGYYAPGPRQYRGLWRVAAGGVCACLSFLAYPQTLAAAPVLMLALLLLGRGSADKCRGLWVFVLTCAVCGGAFVVYVLQGMGFDFAALLARADLILHDPQYDFTTADRLAMLRSQLSAVIGNCWLSALAGVALAAAGMLFGERRGFARSLEKALWYTAFFLSLWCTAYCRRAQELDFRYMCPAFALAGGWTFWCDRREADHRPLRRLLFWLGWLPGIAAYLFILRSTLIALPTTFMYLFWPAVCGTAALLLKPRPTRRHRAAAALLAAGLLLACAVPRLCLVLETGWHCEPITAIQSERITRGPAAGTWADGDGGRGGEASPHLLLVAPNVLAVRRQMDLDMLDLPAWVCLHEMTHAVQLAAAPWLGPYLSDSMRMVIGAVVEAAYGGADGARSAGGGSRQERGRRPRRGRAVSLAARAGRGRVLEGLMNVTDRAEVASLAAALTFLEGHAEVVLDDVHPNRMPSVHRLRAVLSRSRAADGGIGPGPGRGARHRRWEWNLHQWPRPPRQPHPQPSLHFPQRCV